MPITDFLNMTATLERQSGGVDASGATVSAPFAAITGSIGLACTVWPRSSSPFQAQAQMSIKGDYVIAFAKNPLAVSGDRINIAGVFYLVNGFVSYIAPLVTTEKLFLVFTDLWTPKG